MKKNAIKTRIIFNMFLISEKFWEVRETTGKGRGVFAREDIEPGTVIGDYIGKLLPDKEIDEAKQGMYDMHFNDEASILADPQQIGVHLINHSCGSNCDTYPYKGHTLFFALRHIFAGEELTINYLLDPPENGHICNHACHCGTPVCHGTMHTSFAVSEKCRKFVEKVGGGATEHLSMKYGDILSPLNSYPSTIADDPIFDMFGDFRKEPAVFEDMQLPTLTEIRDRIRTTGKQLLLENLNVQIYGIMDEMLLIKM